MRTLLVRLTTAALIVPVFVGSLLWLPNQYWMLFLAGPLLIGGWEWAALTGCRRGGRWLFAGILLTSVVAVLVPVFGSGKVLQTIQTNLMRSEALVYAVSALFWAAIAPMWLLRRWRPRNRLLAGLAGWVVLFPTWLALARLQTRPLDLLTLLCIVWLADSGAYLVGSCFGAHKLAPSISPGKTWEGVLGAVVAVAVYYFSLRLILKPPIVWVNGAPGMVLFVVILVMSIEGDLFESWMKRAAGVKDSGSVLPGHGGVLDRIDGLTATMPIAALMSIYMG